MRILGIMPGKLLDLAARVRTTGFYKEFHARSPAVGGKSDWESLPLLTKGDLIDVPVGKRSYVQHNAVDSIYASSGTTGTLPLFGPRACVRGPLYRLEFHDFTKPCLASIILPHMMEHALISMERYPRIVVLDPKHVVASVALAKSADADSILTHSFLMPIIIEALEKAHMERSIKFVELAGEPCSRSLFEFMRGKLPNASIAPVYGAREVEGPIGIPCRPMSDANPLEVYHPNPDHFFEIVRADGSIVAPAAGVEGELLLTTYAGEPYAFPLLRYRLGDVVRILDDSCEKHGSFTFTVLGRANIDFIKVPGGVLRADEVERVLRDIGASSDEFVLECAEVTGASGPRVQVTLRVREAQDADLSDLAKKFAANLRVSPSYTYADGVRAGTYAPLVCARLKEDAGQSKRKRMVRL